MDPASSYPEPPMVPALQVSQLREPQLSSLVPGQGGSRSSPQSSTLLPQTSSDASLGDGVGSGSELAALPPSLAASFVRRPSGPLPRRDQYGPSVADRSFGTEQAATLTATNDVLDGRPGRASDQLPRITDGYRLHETASGDRGGSGSSTAVPSDSGGRTASGRTNGPATVPLRPDAGSSSHAVGTSSAVTAARGGGNMFVGQHNDDGAPVTARAGAPLSTGGQSARIDAASLLLPRPSTTDTARSMSHSADLHDTHLASHLYSTFSPASTPTPSSSSTATLVPSANSGGRERLSSTTHSAVRRHNVSRDQPQGSGSTSGQSQTASSGAQGEMLLAASQFFGLGGGRSRSGSGSISGQSRRGTGEAEVTANVSLFQSAVPTKHSSSALSKTPILRDVPNVKQRLSKRGSSSSKAEVGPSTAFDRAITLKHSGPSWLRERPSKTKLALPQSSTSSHGTWRRATILFRDNGVLSIFSEDHALLHSIQCANLGATDIRSVEDSLFGRPNVLGIFARPSSFVGATASASASPPPSSGLGAGSSSASSSSALPFAGVKQDPIYLHLSSTARLQYWRALLKIYAQPEVYGPPSSAAHGGTHRRFRQIDMTIFEAKSIMAKLPVDSQDPGHLHSYDHVGSNDETAVSPSWSNRELPYSPRVRPGAADKGAQPRSSLDADTSLNLAGGAADNSTKAEIGSPLASGVSRTGTPFREDPGTADEDGRQSRATSHHDAASINASEVSSLDDLGSGPVTGLAGGNRFTTDSQQQPSSTSSRQRFGSPRTRPARRNRDKDLYTTAAFDRYCRILMNGEVVARTQPRFNIGSADAAYSVEKFRLVDLPEVETLTVEVLHATQKSGGSSGSTSAPGNASQKFVLLGVVEVPIDSLRRGEEVEGRFPIWSIAAVQGGTGEGIDRSMPFHKGMVGELKMSIRVRDETILPLSVYREIDDRLHAPDAPELILGLAKYLSEESVVPHLVDFYAASGTITERLAALADVESASWGERMEPEMLFRANTLLSRSVDHFQRLLALPWLDSCVGSIVRAICDNVRPSQGGSGADATGMPAHAGAEGHADSLAGVRSPALGSWTSDHLPLTVDVLRKLSEALWESIYAQRHRCPPELRTVLSDIRSKVNQRYAKSKSTRPGIQGVGAFIFLRLFCAALNAPQLYGLTPCQPTRTSQRKLLLLSKVLLALASKKPSFDKDKDRDLLPLNDFLSTYGPAFDDYITVVSTEPPKLPRARLLGVSYDDDADLQRSAQRRVDRLPALHRESIPASPYMLDKPLTLASFVSFVVRTAEDREIDRDSNRSDDDVLPSTDHAGDLRRKASDLDRRVDQLIDLCCDAESLAGRLVETAGWQPQPLRPARHSLDPLRSGDVTRLGSVVTTGKTVPPFPHIPSPPPADLTGQLAAIEAAAMSGRLGSVDRSPNRSPSANRARSATVTAGGSGGSPYRSSPGAASRQELGSPSSRGLSPLELDLVAAQRGSPSMATTAKRGAYVYDDATTPGGGGYGDSTPSRSTPRGGGTGMSPQPSSSMAALERMSEFTSESARAAAAARLHSQSMTPSSSTSSSRPPTSTARGIGRVSEEDYVSSPSPSAQMADTTAVGTGQGGDALGARFSSFSTGLGGMNGGGGDSSLLIIDEDGSTSTFEPVYPVPAALSSSGGGGGGDVLSASSSTGFAPAPAATAAAPSTTRRHSSRSASVTPKTSGVKLGSIRRHSAEMGKGLLPPPSSAGGMGMEEQRTAFRHPASAAAGGGGGSGEGAGGQPEQGLGRSIQSVRDSPPIPAATTTMTMTGMTATGGAGGGGGGEKKKKWWRSK